ncbi:anthranilate synthase component II [Agrococcus terreus]|uniref:Glutamine amidotransferase of anthranilate synthase component II (PabA) n=1 Tax=Agrococcus terreus TaxID=574649 RepID=A0ABQ2KC68_9MICO|nr:gamma-glutamyl-gamma-aminobutyrate hydrolase family protein [Agrococcus terreus]GGN77028.1 glutamine amidotransferase of anthranilate synthase component II (PabA) [Agrococcus terreus]
MTRILVVDNFDSFVYTLAGYLQELGAEVSVVRNDEVDAATIDDWDAVLLSPGPGAPADAGVSIPMVHAAIEHGTPLLGVCLGHQAIAEALGGVVTHAPELMHGKTSEVEHDGSTIFAGLPSPLTATRYHSLAIVDGTVPEALRVTSRTVAEDGHEGVIMAVEHRAAPVWGVQFHPESVLTEGGYRMLGNWLEAAGLDGAASRAAGRAPLVTLAPAPDHIA